MTIVNLKQDIPSEKEIVELERKVQVMKQARADAQRRAAEMIKSAINEIPNVLDRNDTLHLIDLLQGKIRGAHKKVRGNRVPPEVKESIETVLKQKDHTLSQIEKMFGVSISYVSKLKKELGLTSHEYVDKQLEHHQPAQEHAVA